MGLIFEGCVEDVSERQLAFIKEILTKKGYNNNTVTIDPVSKAGDNYAANVKRITVTDDNGVFKMIAKIAPQNESMRAVINTRIMFNNEHYMYTETLPKFQDLETEAQISHAGRLRFAECYGSYSEEPHEIILLEDLQASNFTMLDRFKTLTNEYVKSVFQIFSFQNQFCCFTFSIIRIEIQRTRNVRND